MNCERVVPALTTGGVWMRWRARRHIQGCSQCGAKAARLLAITRALAEAPPLTRSQRAVWLEAVAESQASDWVWPIAWRPGAGMAAAALLLTAWSWQAFRSSGTESQIAAGQSPVVEQPSARERLAFEMLTQVGRLESDLDDLRRRADLIGPRNEADALWARYAQSGPRPL